MKYLIYIVLIHSAPVFSQAHPDTVKISPFKPVTVEIPAQYTITRIHPGLEEDFFTVKQIASNLLILQATKNEDFPPSNVAIFCEGAIFYIDVSWQRYIKKYHYPVTADYAITISSTPTTEATPTVTRPDTILTPMTDAITATLDPENLTPDDTAFYDQDRVTLGQSFENGSILAYLSNLQANAEFITASIRLTNNSNVTFHSDAIDAFILTKVKKKSTTNIDDDDPTPYKPLNTFPATVSPNESGLFILRFRKFSLDKNNSLKFVIGEGKGRRTIAFEINSKTFYKTIQPY